MHTVKDTFFSDNITLRKIRSSPILPEYDGSTQNNTLRDTICGIQHNMLYNFQHTHITEQFNATLHETSRNILITSALPYVNNVPHLGNIIGCVLSADVYARFCRLRDYNVLFISGTDEYGTATEIKAREENVTPQQLCDKYHALHAEIYKWFNISFDYFGRTTTAQQTEITQNIFTQLHKNNFITYETIQQLYCNTCNMFLADRFIHGICPSCDTDNARGDQCDYCRQLINAIDLKEPKCKICNGIPVIKNSNHYFINLPKIYELQFHPSHMAMDGWSLNAQAITKSYIRKELKKRCITRDLKWGIPVPAVPNACSTTSVAVPVNQALYSVAGSLVPAMPNVCSSAKVFYVWFDAPIGYISITANYTDQWEKWWKNPTQVELVNFMGKDNVVFHSVMFPCSLLGTDESWTTVSKIYATEYLNYEDKKFSKSRNVGVFGNNAKDSGISADIFRFYLLSVRPETHDTVFSWEDLMIKNNELLNNLGNFINRTLTFIVNNFDSKLCKIELNSDDLDLCIEVVYELKCYIENMENVKLRDGIKNILAISTIGNKYLQVNKPWISRDKIRVGSILSLSANIIALLAELITPYMPQVSIDIWSQLNITPSKRVLDDKFVRYLPNEHCIGVPKLLFKRIEIDDVKRLQRLYSGNISAGGC